MSYGVWFTCRLKSEFTAKLLLLRGDLAQARKDIEDRLGYHESD